MMIQVFGITGLPEIGVDNDLAEMIHTAAGEQGNPLADGDVVVVTSKVVSKAEGCSVSRGNDSRRGRGPNQSGS